MQNGISYASRQLQKHEMNYPNHDLKLALVMHDLKIGNNINMENHAKSSLSQKSQVHVNSKIINLRQ